MLLSRDHHDGLLLVWKIRQGKTYNIDNKVIAEYVAYEFDLNLAPHFSDEENLLFSQASEDPLTQEAVKQHAQLRQMVDELRTEVSEEKLTNFAELLDQHIRFEERQLFPHYEETFDEKELERIGKELETSHHVARQNSWTNEFWVKAKG